MSKGNKFLKFFLLIKIIYTMNPFLKWTRSIKRIYPYNNKEIPINLIKKHLKYQECINLIKNNNSHSYNTRVSNEYDIKYDSLSDGKSYYLSLEEIHSSFSFSGDEETHCVVEDYINHVRRQKKIQILINKILMLMKTKQKK